MFHKIWYQDVSEEFETECKERDELKSYRTGREGVEIGLKNRPIL